jgi:hypothetical protein
MAHFAQLDESNKVIQVIVVSNDAIDNLPFPDSELVGVEFCKLLYGQDTVWKQTSYNKNFRVHFAGIGYSYDENYDAFIPWQPYLGWILNTDTFMWLPPVPMPDDGKRYRWDEATLSWIEVNLPE